MFYIIIIITTRAVTIVVPETIFKFDEKDFQPMLYPELGVAVGNELGVAVGNELGAVVGSELAEQLFVSLFVLVPDVCMVLREN